VLRKMCGAKRDEVTGEWRRLHNEQLHGLYFSPNIQVIKSRTVRWVEHVACLEEKRHAYRVLVERQERKRPFEGLGVDGRII
jgi:hypothetical protein